MTRILRVLALRAAVIAVTSVAVFFVLGRVHDYPQTAQSAAEYRRGDAVFFPIVFNFVNEASSGIKHALTGEESHLYYFPKGRQLVGAEGDRHRLDFEIAMLGAEQGSWREQLRLSHMYAVGWGTKVLWGDAAAWYRRSEQSAGAAAQGEDWRNHSRRRLVRSLIEAQTGLPLL
ncbi:MAG: hypothetical protein ISN26_06165 [Betaproteobacteria bacterium AqS2]|uniref:Uncharacterized protein n=1 Tax=Candidatus Amphirhobacter heronislandensis TaxID=1732024 RepID=A0A930Y381_9GAMM|nr:hypothetical protein [Betaproteobacteria bacterium AqS2]